MKYTYTLLIPTRNEFETISKSFYDVDQSLFTRIIILDAQSNDGTKEWAKENGFSLGSRSGASSSWNLRDDTNSKLFPTKLFLSVPPGFRNAYILAWPCIDTDYVIYWTPDGNSPAEALRRLIESCERGDYDMVIGSRYKDDAKSEDDDRLTAFGNWLFRWLVNAMFRCQDKKMTDPMVMLRAIKTDLPARLDLDWPERTFLEKLLNVDVDWIPLMSARALEYSCPINLHAHETARAICPRIHWEEIPVDEPPRFAGKRKLKPFRWGAVYLAQFFQEFFGLIGKPK